MNDTLELQPTTSNSNSPENSIFVLFRFVSTQKGCQEREASASAKAANLMTGFFNNSNNNGTRYHHHNHNHKHHVYRFSSSRWQSFTQFSQESH